MNSGGIIVNREKVIPTDYDYDKSTGTYNQTSDVFKYMTYGVIPAEERITVSISLPYYSACFFPTIILK